MTAVIWTMADGNFVGMNGKPPSLPSETLSGGLVYRRTGERLYVRVDGAITVLDVWTADCRKCGRPFTFERARGCFPRYANRTCEACH